MRFHVDHVRANVRRSPTEDLLDRLAAYGDQMEPEALEVIERELRDRGVTTADIQAHAGRREGAALRDELGQVLSCSFCRRPAVRRSWGWHRLWGRLPLFPRRFRTCGEHGSKGQSDASEALTI